MNSKTLKIFWNSLKILAFLLLATLLIASWNLYRGGLGLGIITPLSIQILTPDDSDFKVSVDKSELTWTKGPLPIGIKVYGFKMLNKKNEVISEIPEMKISLSLRALLSFKLALGSIEFNKPYLHMFVAKNGNIGIGFNNKLNDQNINAITSLNNQKSYANIYQYLTNFKINKGTFTLHDELTKYSWVFPNVNIAINKNKNYIEAEGVFNLLQDNSLAPLQVVAIFDEKKSMLYVDAEINNFYLNASPGLKKILADAEVEIPLAGNITAFVNLGNTSDMKSFRNRFNKVSFTLEGKNGNIVIPKPINSRYDVKKFSLKGVFEPELKSAKIEDLSLLAKSGGTANASMEIKNIDEAIDTLSLEPIKILMKAKTKNITVDKLKWYWPTILGTNTRIWLGKNINGGMVKSASFDLLFSGTNDSGLNMDEVRGKVLVDKTTVKYLDTMPPVHDVSGEVFLNKDDVRVKINKGKSLNLDLYEADLFFYDIWEPIELASISLKVKGDLHDALTLVDSKPMGFLKAMGLTADNITGYSDTELKLDFPLRKDLTVDMVKVNANAKITKATIPILKEYPLKNADLTLTADNEKMIIKGMASVKNINVDFSWRENFFDKKTSASYDISMILDSEGRKALGLNLSQFNENFLSGLTELKIKAEADKQKKMLINIDADLIQASIYEPSFGITKKKTVPASAKVYLKAKGNSIIAVDSFQFSAANGIDIHGRIDMAKENKLRNIYLDRFVAGRNNASADIAFLDNGSLNIKLKADTFDASSIIEKIEDNQNEKSSLSYALQGTISKLWMSQEGYINKVDLRMIQNDSKIKSFNFKALTHTGSQINASFLPEEKEKDLYNLSLWSDNAGDVFEALGYTNNIKGGTLKIAGVSKEQGTLSGKAQIKNFRVVKAPVLAKILSIASLTGVVDLLQGEGIGFDIAVLPFEYKKSTLYLDDAYTSGISIGLTANGNLKNNILNIEGTIIPAYVFNSLLGKIPLLGALFSGGEPGGGLFAFTYKITGDIDNPKIVVNPLSALAPGVIRKVFTGNDDVNKEVLENEDNH